MSRSLNIARFPISGPKEFPCAEEYALEAVLMWQEARHLDATAGYLGAGHILRPKAKAFERVARKLVWAEQQQLQRKLRVERAA